MKQNNNLSTIKNVKVLTTSALLVAIGIIIDFNRIVVSKTFEISFAFITLAIGGMLYGPVVAGFMGGISDILQYIVRPTGEFFPGFTLNAILSGVIYGIFLYKKEVTIKRVLLCQIVHDILISIILTPIWLNMLYGSAIFALPRIIRFFVMLPIKVILIEGAYKILKRNKIFDRV